MDTSTYGDDGAKYASAEALTSKGDGLAEDDVPTSRGLVRVRALNRFEVLAVSATEKTAGREVMMLTLAMVQPRLTNDEAASWMRNSKGGGDLEDVTTRIAQLSGMMPEAPKEAMKELLTEDGAEFRDVPSAETR